MAQQATPLRFKVALAHVDRDVYESLDLRLAQHPSENKRYLLCRLFAYCALYEEGLAFSRGGLSSPDEAPITQRSLDGRLLLIDALAMQLRTVKFNKDESCPVCGTASSNSR